MQDQVPIPLLAASHRQQDKRRLVLPWTEIRSCVIYDVRFCCKRRRYAVLICQMVGFHVYNFVVSGLYILEVLNITHDTDERVVCG